MPVDGSAQPLAEAFVSLLDWALRWWIGGRDPGLGLLRDNVAELRPVTTWLAGVALALSVVAGAVLLMLRRRGADLAELMMGLGRFALVMFGGWLVLASTWSMSDAIAGWLLGPRPDPQAYREAVTRAVAEADPIMSQVLSIAGIAAVLGFIAMVLARFVIALLLVTGLPVLAAMSVLRSAGNLRLGLAWLAAVLCFRPLASVVYRVSHDLLTYSEEPVLVLVVACLTFLLAASLLPGVARIAAGVHTP